MATNAIITAQNLDINKVSFGEIRQNKAGGKSVPIKYNGQNLQIRIPKMAYPMGINIKETDNGTAYTLSATLKSCDPYAKEPAGPEAGESGHLYNFLLQLQEKLLNTASENSVKWFSKRRELGILRDSMKQFLSPSVEKRDGEWVPNGKYPPSFRMKVPVYDGKVTMDVVDAMGKPVDVNLENIGNVFPKRTEASIVVAPSVYVSGQGFGVTWRVTFARVTPPQRLTAAQVFADEIDAPVQETIQEEVEETVAEAPAPAPEPVAPAPEPAPAPAKNRRRVALV